MWIPKIGSHFASVMLGIGEKKIKNYYLFRIVLMSLTFMYIIHLCFAVKENSGTESYEFQENT